METQRDQFWPRLIADPRNLNIFDKSKLISLLAGLEHPYDNDNDSKDLLVQSLIEVVTPFIGTKIDIKALVGYNSALKDCIKCREFSRATRTYRLMECLFLYSGVKKLRLCLREEAYSHYKVNIEALTKYFIRGEYTYGKYPARSIIKFIEVDKDGSDEYINEPLEFFITKKAESILKEENAPFNCDLIYEKDLPDNFLDILQLYQLDYATSEDKDNVIVPIIPGHKVSIVMVDEIFPMAVLSKGSCLLSLPPYGISVRSLEDCSSKIHGLTVVDFRRTIPDSVVTRITAFIISKFPEDLFFKSSNVSIFNAEKKYVEQSVYNSSTLTKLVENYAPTPYMVNKVAADWMEGYIYKKIHTDPGSVKIRDYYGSIIYIEDYTDNYDELKEECLKEAVPRFNKALANIPILSDAFDVNDTNLTLAIESVTLIREATLFVRGQGGTKESYDIVFNSFFYGKKPYLIIDILACIFNNLMSDGCALLQSRMFILGDIKEEITGSVPIPKTYFTSYKEALPLYLKSRGCDYVDYMTDSQIMEVMCRGYMNPTVLADNTLDIMRVIENTHRIRNILFQYRLRHTTNKDVFDIVSKKSSHKKYYDHVFKILKSDNNNIMALCKSVGMMVHYAYDPLSYYIENIDYVWYLFKISSRHLNLRNNYKGMTEVEITQKVGITYYHTGRSNLEDMIEHHIHNEMFFHPLKGRAEPINDTYVFGFGEKGEEDQSPYHPDSYSICFGTSSSYYAYTIQQIRAGFINENNDSRSREGSPSSQQGSPLPQQISDERSFKIYDQLSGGSFRPLLFDQVVQLKYLLADILATGDCDDDTRLELESTIHEICICESLVVVADAEDVELVKVFNTFDDVEREKVSDAFLQMFYLGMRFRQWDGTPNIFPMSVEDTVNVGFDKDEDTSENKSALIAILDSMGTPTKDFFNGIKLMRNNNGKMGKSNTDTFGNMWGRLNSTGYEEEQGPILEDLATYHSNKTFIRENKGKEGVTDENLNEALSKMNDVLDKYEGVLPKIILLGEQCIRIASSYFVGSGYHYGMMMDAFKNGEQIGFRQYEVVNIQ